MTRNLQNLFPKPHIAGYARPIRVVYKLQCKVKNINNLPPNLKC